MILQRAGGGHSFSGGGGGGGHFGGGGGIGHGGGFIFLGGGGGGGAGAAIFIVVLIVVVLLVALFVATRRRRGAFAGVPEVMPYPHYDQPAMPHEQAPSSTDALQAIEAHDPEFNLEAFKSSVERSFFVVEEAWTELKPDMSRRVMADALWQQHKTQIEGYVNNGTRNVLDGLAVGRVDVIGASSDDRLDTITVRILAACADYDIEVASGKVVRGNKHEMTNWQEDWLFQRSSKATTKNDGGTMQQKCPNCGAPLDVDLAGVCKYCRAPVMSGEYDWVLARIDQVA